MVSSWRKKAVFRNELLSELEELFSDRNYFLETVSAVGSTANLRGSANSHNGSVPKKQKLGKNIKNDILRKIEEDRELHKKIKEGQWFVSCDADPDFEFTKYWNSPHSSTLLSSDWAALRGELASSRHFLNSS
ncbi:CTD kinase subunit gamma [Smittium culicis]|uniref:CTD kinase subunit gamma n=1 Tax=Smittium culicis TaxID=133412 RepID=A0A1R1XBF8_9FUNG|nr:CTD kinase subunit gamma [Smittium culicis]OMJ24421.1 CTD kinase subunit gamma [Smittium culicis]